MLPSEIGPESCFWSKRLPHPQLTRDLGLPLRVYALGSGDFVYVGIEHQSKVGQRIRDHFAGRGSHFTKEHRPTEVLGVWTVMHTAAEGYIFSLVLATMGPNCLHRLGGFTQTSVTPSPLCKQQFEEQRRLLRNLCFRCGGNHWAKNCSKEVQGVEYKCPSCRGSILISSRGQSVMTSHGSIQEGQQSRVPCSSGARSFPAHPQISLVDRSVNVPLMQPVKRTLETASSSPPAKVAKRSDHEGKSVLVCGQKYAGVSWFTGRANPPPKFCARAKATCKAIELTGGDLRSLVQHGYAGQRPKEILPGRERLSTSWVETDIVCDRSKLQVRLVRPDYEPVLSLRQCLFLVADLEKVP